MFGRCLGPRSRTHRGELLDELLRVVEFHVRLELEGRHGFCGVGVGVGFDRRAAYRGGMMVVEGEEPLHPAQEYLSTRLRIFLSDGRVLMNNRGCSVRPKLETPANSVGIHDRGAASGQWCHSSDDRHLALECRS